MKKISQKQKYYFLIAVILIYIILAIFSFESTLKALKSFVWIFIKLIPVLAIVFIIMALTEKYFRPNKVVKYLGKGSGIKRWFIAIVAGIISTGPIFLWHPMLGEMQKKGMSTASAAIFLYNRAVKPALIPMLIIYFGIKYTIVLTVVMIFFSLFVGFITERIVDAI